MCQAVQQAAVQMTGKDCVAEAHAGRCPCGRGTSRAGRQMPMWPGHKQSMQADAHVAEAQAEQAGRCPCGRGTSRACRQMPMWPGHKQSMQADAHVGRSNQKNYSRRMAARGSAAGRAMRGGSNNEKLLPPVNWRWVKEGDGYVRHEVAAPNGAAGGAACQNHTLGRHPYPWPPSSLAT